MELLEYLTSRNLPVMMIIVDGHVVGVPAVLEHRPFIQKSTYNIYCAVGICSYTIRYYSYVSGLMRLCCVAGHRVMIFQLRMLYIYESICTLCLNLYIYDIHILSQLSHINTIGSIHCGCVLQGGPCLLPALRLKGRFLDAAAG